MDNILWVLFRPAYKLFIPHSSIPSFSIGVTTFLDRYENCLKPLIRKLVVIFPDCQIIVIANGHVLQEKQKTYLRKIEKFCNSFTNIELITHHQPRGLSHLWNQIVQHSQFNGILLLNDDIKIKMNFTEFIRTSGILNK
jgi:hypothetical protein